MSFNLNDNGKVDHKFALWFLIIIFMNLIIITEPISRKLVLEHDQRSAEICSAEMQKTVDFIVNRSAPTTRLMVFVNEKATQQLLVSNYLKVFKLNQSVLVFDQNQDDHGQLLGNENALVFLIANHNELPQISTVSAQHPNLIKLIFAYDECSAPPSGNINRTADMADAERIQLARINIEQFMKSQWNTNKNLYNYFVPICMDVGSDSISNKKACSIDYFYYFDPFVPATKAATTPLTTTVTTSQAEIIPSNNFDGGSEVGGGGNRRIEKETENEANNDDGWGMMKVYVLADRKKAGFETNAVNRLADKANEINGSMYSNNTNNVSLDLSPTTMTTLMKTLVKQKENAMLIDGTSSSRQHRLQDGHSIKLSSARHRNYGIRNDPAAAASDKNVPGQASSHSHNTHRIDGYGGGAGASSDGTKEKNNQRQCIFNKDKVKLNGKEFVIYIFYATQAYEKALINLSQFRNKSNGNGKNTTTKTSTTAATTEEETMMALANSTAAYFGEDIEFLLELSNQMKFNMRLTQAYGNFYGLKLPNGTFNGALGYLNEGRADLFGNACFVKDYESENLEFTAAMNDDKLCIIVKTAKLIPHALLIFRCFKMDVWLLTILTLFVVASFYNFLLNVFVIIGKEPVQSRAASNFYTKVQRIGAHSIHVMNVMLNAPENERPRATAISERMFIFTCFMWGLIMTGTFQGSLVEKLSTPASYPNIDTLEQLDSSGMWIAVRHQGLIVDLFGDEQPGTPLGNLRQKLFGTEDDLINVRVAAEGGFASLRRLADFTLQSDTFVHGTRTGYSNLYTVGECPRSYTLAYLLPKSSVYKETINWYVLIFAQSGLYSKWQRDSKFAFNLQHEMESRARDYHTGNIILTLDHLQTAFVLLLIGGLISLSVFVWELLIGMGHLRKTN